MIEYELTYLAKYLPKDLSSCPSTEMMDVYIPAAFEHARIRIRKNGERYEITKKEPAHGSDSSEQIEQTIRITKEEFEELKNIPGKIVRKRRYLYNFLDHTAEIDIFEGDLAGLVLVDFEFKTRSAMEKFVMPDFCLSNVSQEQFVAGGVLCGKSYEDIEQDLKIYNYNKIVQ